MEPSVVWQSTERCGSHSRSSRAMFRISTASCLTWSRLRFQPAPVYLVPTPPGGPICPSRFLRSRALFLVEMRSFPSGLKSGTRTRVRRRRMAGSRGARARSRASISTASFPSTSPAWMLAWTRTTARPFRRAASGEEAPPEERTRTGMSRPSPDFPMERSRTRRLLCARAAQNISTSAWREVSVQRLCSARVSSSGCSKGAMAVSAPGAAARAPAGGRDSLPGRGAPRGPARPRPGSSPRTSGRAPPRPGRGCGSPRGRGSTGRG